MRTVHRAESKEESVNEARGRVLRSSTLGQWTKEEYERARRKNEKKKQAEGETREEGLASSSGKVRDKDVKVV
ncbi:hypothetical protein V1478_000328 [Vespula squamosa]|uniref:Uncharacterized protein n=1 Tax=Vespula squamosa TaxID=30214 RepID=A0ABD2C562_VESSQ